MASCDACLVADRKKEKERFDDRIEIAARLKSTGRIERLCVMCGLLYDAYHTSKGVESTRCLECQDSMRKQDQKRADRERNYKNEHLRNMAFYLKAYQFSAKRRNYAFELSLEQFERLVTKPCFYCDYHKEGEVNGIDRLDNNKGYTVENSKPCCEMCNHMKQMYHVQYFLAKVGHIATDSPPESSFHDTWNYSKSLCTTTYSRQKHNCKGRKIEFLLTERQWNELINGICYICGFSGTAIGIDRFDNSTRSYTYDNCKPCCRPCNLMKFTYSFEELKKQCKKIHAKWPDPSVFASIPHVSTDLPCEHELLLEPEDMKCANVLVYSDEDNMPARNTVEMITDVEPRLETAETAETAEPVALTAKERWTAPKLYLDIVANDTAAFLASNAHVLSAEEFKAFAEDIRTKKKDDALPLLKTYLNTLRVRRTRAKKRTTTDSTELQTPAKAEQVDSRRATASSNERSLG